MDAVWIVSANAGRARIFSQDKPTGPLQEIKDMANPAARLRTADTESDKIGPTAATKSIHNVGGATPNKTYEPNQTPDEHQAELFARSIADHLLKSRQAGNFRQLILVMTPEFLGVVRGVMDPNLSAVVSLEINKDYTQCNAAQLLDKIQTYREKA